MSLMQRLILLFLTLLLFSGSFAQNLEIYTMEGCGNCIRAREYLTEKNIPYIEYPTADKKNATDMWNHLTSRGYSVSMVTMPVILFNGKLIHPYMETEKKRISLSDALTYIINNQNKATQVVESSYYLVCGEFVSLPRANHFVMVLELEGYKSAGYYEENGRFYVYAMCLSDYKEAWKQCEELKEKYRGTHVVSF